MEELRIKSSSKIVIALPATPSFSQKFEKNSELSLPRMAVIITNIVNNGFWLVFDSWKKRQRVITEDQKEQALWEGEFISPVLS